MEFRAGRCTLAVTELGIHMALIALFRIVVGCALRTNSRLHDAGENRIQFASAHCAELATARALLIEKAEFSGRKRDGQLSHMPQESVSRSCASFIVRCGL